MSERARDVLVAYYGECIAKGRILIQDVPLTKKLREKVVIGHRIEMVRELQTLSSKRAAAWPIVLKHQVLGAERVWAVSRIWLSEDFGTRV